jgi:hypothetical protein
MNGSIALLALSQIVDSIAVVVIAGRVQIQHSQFPRCGWRRFGLTNRTHGGGANPVDIGGQGLTHGYQASHSG